MIAYKFDIDLYGGELKFICTQHDTKHVVSINPKSVMKVESISSLDGINGFSMDGYATFDVDDCGYEIATLWDKARYVIDENDASEIRKNYWGENL